MRRAALLLTALAAVASAASLSAPVKPALTEAENAAVRLASERGALLYAYDRAAWVATDDLRAKLSGSAQKIGGWIVDGPINQAQIVFYDQDASDPHILYSATVVGGKVIASRVLGPGDDRSLSPARKAMVAALRSATASLVAAKVSVCNKAQSLNPVVLPAAGPGEPILVYFLNPQTNLNVVPLGGHYRVAVGADGRAGAPRRFMNSCMEMPISGTRGTPEALVVSHVLDPVPTEIHVFSSLVARLPLFVPIGRNRVWVVDGPRIRPVAKKK